MRITLYIVNMLTISILPISSSKQINVVWRNVWVAFWAEELIQSHGVVAGSCWLWIEVALSVVLTPPPTEQQTARVRTFVSCRVYFCVIHFICNRGLFSRSKVLKDFVALLKKKIKSH